MGPAFTHSVDQSAASPWSTSSVTRPRNMSNRSMPVVFLIISTVCNTLSLTCRPFRGDDSELVDAAHGSSDLLGDLRQDLDEHL